MLFEICLLIQTAEFFIARNSIIDENKENSNAQFKTQKNVA